MFSYAKLSKIFLGGSFDDCKLLANWSPTKSNQNQMTTYQIWFGHQPNLSHLKIFGCNVHVLIHKEEYKLDTHFIKCIFLGYSE
jgi:hypothetical protein